MYKQITLQDALKLPQAQYATLEESGIHPHEIVAADVNAAVIVTPASRQSVAATLVPLYNCVCVVVENIADGTLALAHMEKNRPPALEKLIGSVRRRHSEPLRVHLIGGISDPCFVKEWETEKHRIMKILNRHPNTTLATFDIENKPHPTRMAVMPGKDGGTASFIRFSSDIGSPEEYRELEHRVSSKAWDGVFWQGKWHAVECMELPHSFHPAPEEPYRLTYDGRRPEHQKPRVERPAFQRRADAPSRERY